MRVDLILVNVAANVSADDGKATRLVQMIQHDILPNACPAIKYLGNQKPSEEESKAIQQGVLRYLQPKDKYASLVSILLKSRAFHMTRHLLTDDSQLEERHVVDLPRTEHNKPYIPVARSMQERVQLPATDLFPISISHQHPFVGIAQLESSANENQESAVLVGLDIVIFESFHPKLYSDEDEFLETFHDCFTSREWGLIQASSQRLQEFYIRWSTKEAYTKALGIGMGKRFSSFDIRLSTERNIYQLIQNCDEQLFLDGVLEGCDTEEKWSFGFLPLGYSSVRGDVTKGCACVCLGPNPRKKLELHIDWMDLGSLIDFHQN